MDRNDIIWVLECCLFSLDNCTKEQMIELGASEKLAEAGIKLCSYLKSLKFEINEMQHQK